MKKKTSKDVMNDKEDFVAKMRREMEEVRVEREEADKTRHNYSNDIKALHEKVDDKVVKTGEMIDELAAIAGIEVNSFMMVNSAK